MISWEAASYQFLWKLLFLCFVSGRSVQQIFQPEAGKPGKKKKDGKYIAVSKSHSAYISLTFTPKLIIQIHLTIQEQMYEWCSENW